MNRRKRTSCYIFLLIAILHSELAGSAAADPYFWIGSGAWSDKNNWDVPTNPDNNLPPDGDDEAYFYQSSSVNLDQSTGVKVAEFGSGTYSFSLAGTSLNVSNQNLFHVGAGGAATVSLSGSGTITANGTLLGATSGSTGTLNIPGGVTLQDNELSIGYTGKGTLNLSGGGQAKSNGAIFLGGFETGDGTATVSGSGSKLTASSFIAVGNQGTGSLTVQSGGDVSASQFYLAGFETGSGEMTVKGGSSSSILLATDFIDVGFAGDGRLYVEGGGTVLAPRITIGDAATADGVANVSGSNAVLTASISLVVGSHGTGSLFVSDGGQVNVAGDRLTAGGSSDGAGSVTVEGAGSKISGPDAWLRVGGAGSGQLTVAANAQVNVKVLDLGSGASSMGQASLTGAGKLDAQFIYLEGGHAELEILNSAQATAGLVVVGTGDAPNVNATLAVRGSGSKLATADLEIGVQSGMSNVTIESGGRIAAPIVSIASDPSAQATLTVDGASSELQTSAIYLGSHGHGTLAVKNGASFTLPSGLILGSSSGSDGRGDVIVQDQGTNANLGAISMFEGTGGITASNHAQLTTSAVQLGNGSLTVQTGATAAVTGGLTLGRSSGENSSVMVNGAGSSLTVGASSDFGRDGKATITVNSGGAVTGRDFIQSASRQANSTGIAEIHVNGAGSTFTADKVLMLAANNVFDVSGGGHAWVKQYLELGDSQINLGGGSVDVGVLIGPSPADTVRVGPFAYFASSRSIPNVQSFGGNVHVGGSPGIMSVTGNFSQDASSVLSMSIAGTTAGAGYSQLAVGGNLQLAGKIRISFENGFAPQAGQSFDLITVGGTSQLTGPQIEVKNLAAGFTYSFLPFAGGYRFTALTNGAFVAPAAGDFNSDGLVDGIDLLSWRGGFGVTTATRKQGDANGDGAVNGADFLIWHRQASGSAATPTTGSVPEPSGLLLAYVGWWWVIKCAAPRLRGTRARLFSL